MSERECRCGKPTDAYFCPDCGHELSVALGEIPWLDQELETTISRQKGVDYRAKSGTRSTEKPLPIVPSVVEARRHLKGVLVAWVKFCADDGIRHQSPNGGLPADDLSAISRWLLWRVDGLALHDIGPEAVDEITSAVAHCRRLVDRPADRQFLGRCGMCERVGDDGRLYGRPGSQAAVCQVCGHSEDAAALRERLLTELDDRLLTASEIARMSTYLGLKADREQVRKRIEYWARKGVVRRATSISDVATYRFGDVYAKLMQADYGNKAS